MAQNTDCDLQVFPNLNIDMHFTILTFQMMVVSCLPTALNVHVH